MRTESLVHFLYQSRSQKLFGFSSIFRCLESTIRSVRVPSLRVSPMGTSTYFICTRLPSTVPRATFVQNGFVGERSPNYQISLSSCRTENVAPPEFQTPVRSLACAPIAGVPGAIRADANSTKPTHNAFSGFIFILFVLWLDVTANSLPPNN